MPKVNRPWKAERQKKRREEAEKRNAVYEALPDSEKRKRNPKKFEGKND